ncbi:hypothetical protein ACFFIY_05180 [Bhargavaea ullalensis]|uniref:YtpI-like protein n=1 Tax=Bhargavaea ullalensis TaxID=1265685 RepID=A0ABV2G9J5_9BACL
MMSVIEFLGIAAGVAILVLLVSYGLEKLTGKVAGRKLGRCMRITVSLGLALALLGAATMAAGHPFPFLVAILVGMAILLNRYWMGHFSEEQA